MGTRTYSVPKGNLVGLEEKLAGFAKKAKRRGLEVPTLKVLGETWKWFHRTRDGYVVPGKSPSGGGFERLHVDVEVTGTELVIEGWELVGLVEHATGSHKNLVHSFVDDYKPAKKYRTCVAYCEHCDTHRPKKWTFLLRKVGTKRVVKRVGRTCLRDFVGGNCPHNVAAMAEWVKEFNGTDLSSYERLDYGYEPSVWRPFEVLRVAAFVVETEGFRSRARATEDGGTSTGDDVRSHLLDLALYGSTAYDRALKYEKEVYKPKRHDAKAKAVEAWIPTLKGDSEYVWNLKTVVETGAVDAKHIPLVASAVAVYDREKERERTRKAARKGLENSDYLAEPGDKFGRKLTAADKRKGATAYPALEVTLLSRRGVNTFYGYSTLCTFVTDDGNVVTWWDSGGSADDLEDGKRYKVVATVKKHETFNGVKRTVVTRAVVTPA